MICIWNYFILQILALKFLTRWRLSTNLDQVAPKLILFSGGPSAPGLPPSQVLPSIAAPSTSQNISKIKHEHRLILSFYVLEMKDFHFILGQATYCVLYIILYTLTRVGLEQLWFSFCLYSRNHRRMMREKWTPI